MSEFFNVTQSCAFWQSLGLEVHGGQKISNLSQISIVTQTSGFLLILCFKGLQLSQISNSSQSFKVTQSKFWVSQVHGGQTYQIWVKFIEQLKLVYFNKFWILQVTGGQKFHIWFKIFNAIENFVFSQIFDLAYQWQKIKIWVKFSMRLKVLHFGKFRVSQVCGGPKFQIWVKFSMHFKLLHFDKFYVLQFLTNFRSHRSAFKNNCQNLSQILRLKVLHFAKFWVCGSVVVKKFKFESIFNAIENSVFW